VIWKALQADGKERRPFELHLLLLATKSASLHTPHYLPSLWLCLPSPMNAGVVPACLCLPLALVMLNATCFVHLGTALGLYFHPKE
jgi:hypothetical protein